MVERLLRLIGMHHRCKLCNDRIWSVYYYIDEQDRRSHGICYATSRLIDACQGTARDS